MTRDKFLTEAMGYEFYDGAGFYVLPSKPTMEYSVKASGIDFSSGNNFFILWEWSQKQAWWNIFALEFFPSKYKTFLASEERELYLLSMFINPDRFADTLCEFLKEE